MTEDRQAQEVWETTTGGTVYVHVKDPRNPNGWVQKKVGGRGTKRITVSVDEREFNQDLVTYENEQHDPFRNGLLRRISPKDPTDKGQNEVADDELIEYLKLDDDQLFTEYYESLDSEVVLRRLLALGERHCSMYRFNHLKDHIDSKYALGKTQRVVKEMYEDDARYQAADL